MYKKRIGGGLNVQSIVVSLIIINVVVFLLSEVAHIPVPRGLLNALVSRGKTELAFIFQRYGLFITVFSLFPLLIRQYGWAWQVFTYMFLHGSLLHIFFNMYALILFGRPLEQRWGKGEFLKFYLFTGVGAGIVTFLWNLVSSPLIPTIGASGAIFGIVLAFGLEFPETVLLLFFIIPVRARYAALIFGGIELAMIATGSMRGIGHFTHLAGLLFGYLYYLWRIRGRYARRRPSWRGRIQNVLATRVRPLSGQEKERAVMQATAVKNKLDRGIALSVSDERFLARLRDAYNRSGGELCGPDEFNPSASDCLRCDSFHACLYRYILDIL